jgi:DNA-binding beta-propeller fold protein YncE
MKKPKMRYAYAIVVTLFCTMLRICVPVSHAAAPPKPPNLVVDPSWPKPLPNNWITADPVGTCVDSHDHVFVTYNLAGLTPHEKAIGVPAPPIIEFDPDGNVVNAWGDPNVVPAISHGCFVDQQDNIWIGGNNDGIIQEYSHDGKLLLQIGTRGKLDTSDGTVTGAPMNSSHTSMNKPASIAIDPSNGDVYVADGYGNRRIVVFDREGHFLRQWGRQGTTAENEAGMGGVFSKIVHCVVLGNDGLVYVCEREGNRVQVFDKMGNFKKNILIKKGPGSSALGTACALAFSRDPAQTFMFVTDCTNDVLLILDHATGEVLSVTGRPGHQAGEFSFLHSIAVDSKGNVIVGETIGGRRVQKFRPVPAS